MRKGADQANVFIEVRIINSQGITYDSQTLAHDMAHELAKIVIILIRPCLLIKLEILK